MLLTLSTIHRPATDLGFLLRKNPARAQSVDLTFGRAHVFYPEASDDRCTVALLVEVDPVGLSRRAPEASSTVPLQPYVNDRPYVASSLLSVAIGRVFGTALTGRSDDRPELAASAIPLEVSLPTLPCSGGESVLRKLFEPLGYTVTAERHPWPEAFASWRPGNLHSVRLSAVARVRDVLAHLFVLIPVLDDDKHYWVGDDEVEKLLRRGEGWLATHPERDLIARRYLKHRRALVRTALMRLSDDSVEDEDEVAEARAAEEEAVEKPISLNEQRLEAVCEALRAEGAKRVLDLGCGEGKLVRRLLDDATFTDVVGLDVSHRALENAADRLNLERMPPRKRERLKLLHGSLFYRDARLAGFDAAAVVEVIEHLDPPRLGAFSRVLFEHARPTSIVLTTPNAEYNVRFPTLPAGTMRHRDHRFEWTRAEFEEWARGTADRAGYDVRFAPIGTVDPEVGPPTQMAVFRRREANRAEAAR